MFNIVPALDSSSQFRAINDRRLAKKNNQIYQRKLYTTLTNVVNNNIPKDEFQIYDTDLVILKKEPIDNFEINNCKLTIPCINSDDISPVVIKQSEDDKFKQNLLA